MTPIDVTKNNHEELIKLGFGLETLKGLPWMCKGVQRLNWDKIEIFGNVIVCHFGEFKFIEKIIERTNKGNVHYWILEDVKSGKIYKIKRDQVRNNKKLNPSWEQKYEIREIVEEKIETPKLTELFPMPLLLPAPKSDLEFLQKYVADTLKKENDGFNEDEIEELRCETYTLKLFVILLGFCDRNNLKKHYKTLANKFHPDKGGDEKLFKELQSAYESETRFD